MQKHGAHYCVNINLSLTNVLCVLFFCRAMTAVPEIVK